MSYRSPIVGTIICGVLVFAIFPAGGAFGRDSKTTMASQSITLPVAEQPQRVVRQVQKTDLLPERSKPNNRSDLQATAGQAQLRPALGRTANGSLLRGYESHDGGAGAKSVYWQSSTDSGASWRTPISFISGAAYPTIDYWGAGTTLYGTVVSPSSFYNGAGVILMEFDTSASPTSWTAWWTDFGDNGWHDMSMSSIASGNSAQSWNWGLISLVMNYTDPDTSISNAPHIYSQINSLGQVQISWYPQYPGCATTAAVIDTMANRTYAAYDRYNSASHQWQLFIRQDYFDDWFEPTNSAVLRYTDTLKQLRYPAIVAADDTVLLVATTYSANDSVNTDIVCWGTYAGDPDSLHYLSLIAGTVDRESYPAIGRLTGRQYVCTFVKNAALYAVISCDAGLSWSLPARISTAGEIVVDEYRTASISDGGRKVSWEYVSGTDTLLHMADLGCLDVDTDGVCYCSDNCPLVYNPGQTDSNSDGIGDACNAMCGDANGDWRVNVGDVVYIINYIFKSGPPPVSAYAGDPNADGRINIGDAVYLINYIFKSGPTPCHL